MEYSIFKDNTTTDQTSPTPIGKRPFGRMAHSIDFNGFDDEVISTPSAPQIVDTKDGATRKRVGKAGMNEFTLPARQSSRSKTHEIEYAPARKKNKVRKSTSIFNEMPTWKKVMWGMYALMILRLIFMQGGLLDFYYMEQALNEKQSEIAMLQAENESIADDIEKLRTDRNFQKKTARENLGVIAEDEYLVVFAREVEGKSI